MYRRTDDPTGPDTIRLTFGEKALTYQPMPYWDIKRTELHTWLTESLIATKGLTFIMFKVRTGINLTDPDIVPEFEPPIEQDRESDDDPEIDALLNESLGLSQKEIGVELPEKPRNKPAKKSQKVSKNNGKKANPRAEVKKKKPRSEGTGRMSRNTRPEFNRSEKGKRHFQQRGRPHQAGNPQRKIIQNTRRKFSRADGQPLESQDRDRTAANFGHWTWTGQGPPPGLHEQPSSTTQKAPEPSADKSRAPVNIYFAWPPGSNPNNSGAVPAGPSGNQPPPWSYYNS